MNRRRTRRLSYMLSLLVTAGAFVPPPLYHSHDGGDASFHEHVAPLDSQLATEVHHHHHVAGGVGHHHPHDGESDFAGHSACGIMAEGTASVHGHWNFFGIEFALPIPCDDDCGEESQRIYLTVVQLPDEWIQNSSMIDDSSCSIRDVPPTLEVYVAPLARIGHERWRASFSLCDSARLQRSSVLLA